MKKNMLESYAKLVVKMGINLQVGQEVRIMVSTNQVDFAERLVEECYNAGAKYVKVDWSNSKISRMKFNHEEQEVLNEIRNSRIEEYKEAVETLPCVIFVEDSDPDKFKGIDTKKIAEMRKSQYPKIKKFREAMDNRYQWCIVAMPSIDWAVKVFPELNEKDAFLQLEKAIIKCTRLENDPVKNWEDHIDYLLDKAKKMNSYNFKELQYSSSNGTDLILELQPGHSWLSARETHLGGIEYSANMPTEEVFTMPKRDGVNGVVYSTKPLSYNGNLIEDFKVVFKNGKAIEVEAKKGQKVLEELIGMDDGACHLGEVALVPYDSPINQTGILFLSTLFDENAACHLAFGESFSNNLKGYENMSDEEIEGSGRNRSMVHVDFMIGSKDLNVVGRTMDGKEVLVFKDGMWNI
jgi:aminopeptidase